MAKKKRIYTIQVEDGGIYDVFFGIKADNCKEAKETAKDRFIKRHWKKDRLKAFTKDVVDNI